MKIVIIKSNLQEALNSIEGSSGENLNLPILKYILITVQDNKITLTTTNLEVAINYTISGKIIENGKATIPLSVFKNIINNIQTERINIEKQKNNIDIKTDNYQATIQTLYPEDFPIIPKISNPTQKKEHIEIDGGVLKEAIQQTIIATQQSDLRPELSSIFFHFDPGEGVRLASTDSFRLAEKTIPPTQYKTTHQEVFKLIIPLKTAQELTKILKKDNIVGIHHDQNQILFKTTNIEFISRVIDGVFPDYQPIVPKKFDCEITLDREEFIDALKLAGIFSAKINEVKIKIPDGKKTMEIFSTDQSVGENHYILPVKTTGKVAEIGFNWKHIVDGLRAIKTEKVFFGLNNEDSKASLIKSPNEAFYFYVLMPILRA